MLLIVGKVEGKEWREVMTIRLVSLLACREIFLSFFPPSRNNFNEDGQGLRFDSAPA